MIPPLDPRVAGIYRGRHHTAYIRDVEALRRAKRLRRAEALLLALVDAAEAEARAVGCAVPPWYYEQLATLRHRRGDFTGEIAILERFAAQDHPGNPPLLERLERLRRCGAGASPEPTRDTSAPDTSG